MSLGQKKKTRISKGITLDVLIAKTPSAQNRRRRKDERPILVSVLAVGTRRCRRCLAVAQDLYAVVEGGNEMSYCTKHIDAMDLRSDKCPLCAIEKRVEALELRGRTLPPDEDINVPD